jgi:glycosyltransferase involved in cell wall biosynthesis
LIIHTPLDQPERIVFVATRISGTDGVSLEIKKWAEILESMGHDCFYIAGLSDRSAEKSIVIPEAHFKHPVIEEINRQSFNNEIRSPEISSKIREMTWVIKEKLREGLHQFGADIIVAENCVTIPMNIPLGLAIVEIIMETGIDCIAHHHDFVWERERFLVNGVDDYLKAAFPPPLRQMQHVAINSQAASEFSRRTGISCRVIPNVMDFDHPSKLLDEYSRDFRLSIGLKPDDFLILQPTRVVRRKGIETTIEMIRRLDDSRCKLVITHAAGDEGSAYFERVRSYAELLGVEIIFAEPWIASERGRDPEGRKVYTIWDAYANADLITYPSTYEGFGNAFLETVYYKKPILANRYSIYRTDIEPCGFRAILMDGFLTDEVLAQVKKVLGDQPYRQEMTELNYEIGSRFFSYARAEVELRALLGKPRLASARTSLA